MTKNKKVILVVAILSAIIVSFFGGQSFSKYVSQVRGEGQAQVAKWHFLVNGNTDAIQTIDLLSTCNSGSLAGNKIAPGTQGAFEIEIDATESDVGIEYDIDIIEKTQKPANLIFKYQGITFETTEALAHSLSGGVLATSLEKKITLPVEWEWKYETGNTPEEIVIADAQDTSDGRNITNYSFDIIITGTQMIPQE